MDSYELACYLILGGLIALFLFYLAIYLVNNYRDKVIEIKTMIRSGIEMQANNLVLFKSPCVTIATIIVTNSHRAINPPVLYDIVIGVL